MGEFRTQDINCESFSCIVPDQGSPEGVRCGEFLQWEIDLVTPDGRASRSPFPQLRGEALILRVTALQDGRSEVVCRLLGYELA